MISIVIITKEKCVQQVKDFEKRNRNAVYETFEHMAEVFYSAEVAVTNVIF